MHFPSFLVLAAAGFTAAQYTTTGAASPYATGASSGCVKAIDLIVNTCLDSETAKVESCAANDWSCLCSTQQQVLTCYNNCPSDPRAFGAKQQETQWCAAAKQYPSTSKTYSSVRQTKTTGPSPTKAPGHSGNAPSNQQTGTQDGGAGIVGAPLAGVAVMALGAVALL